MAKDNERSGDIRKSKTYTGKTQFNLRDTKDKDFQKNKFQSISGESSTPFAGTIYI
jgi:hypothetical protein